MSKEHERGRSVVLTNAENERCHDFMSKPKCLALSIGVVKLLLTEPPQHAEWKLKAIGVVGFIKDWTRRSFFIRMFDFDKSTLIWEEEIYDEWRGISMSGNIPFCHFEAKVFKVQITY